LRNARERRTRDHHFTAFRTFWLATTVAVGLVFAGTATASAKYASLIMDADTGRVLQATNADTRTYPASLTKMMTLYLVFDALNQKRWTLDTPLEVSARAARQPASKLALATGSTISVDEAILALVTKSANDVATTVAEGMSGSEREFALKMTATARRLGMKNTTFRNASGLPHSGQMTTARDMALLARALLRDFPKYYRFFATETFTYDGLTHRNHNELLGAYDGVDGIKTGYIRASGYNLVASAKRNGHRLIGVVLGGQTSSSRNRAMAKLLDRGFNSVGAADTQVAEATAPTAPTSGAASTSVADAGGDDIAEADGDGAQGDAPPAGDWAVQVGAYRTQNPAQDGARKAIGKVPEVLSDGIIRVVPLKKKHGVLYRARIAGLDKGQAETACSRLERKGMDCLVVYMKDESAAAAR